MSGIIEIFEYLPNSLNNPCHWLAFYLRRQLMRLMSMAKTCERPNLQLYYKYCHCYYCCDYRQRTFTRKS